MRSQFAFNGLTLHISGDGEQIPIEQASTPKQPGYVAFAVTGATLPGLDPRGDGEVPPERCLCSFYISPSHARAVASALLSAAVEARDGTTHGRP
jgi:hypothetical protein